MYNQLKYAFIHSCFLFLIWRSSKFFVKVDSIIWLSSSRKKHFSISSSIAKDSTKLTDCFFLAIILLFNIIIIWILLYFLAYITWSCDGIDAIFS